MDEDASLSDFLDTGADESDAETDDTASDQEGPPTEDGPRATTTYVWDMAGAACDSCGEVVKRRWQQTGELVCVACKSW